MGPFRIWLAAACVVVAASAAVAVYRSTGAPRDCGIEHVADVVPARPGLPDVLVSDAPWDGEVSVRVGQRLVVVLANDGLGGWTTPMVDGDAVRLAGVAGAYDYRCGLPSAIGELAVLQADQPGTATLSAVTDAGCFHVQPACSMPQREWRRTVTVTE